MNPQKNSETDIEIVKARRELKSASGEADYVYSKLYDENQRILLTELGERTVYDAASQCNRCGKCLEICPSYAASRRESMSPRGRNQLVRLLIEDKLSDPESLREALDTCCRQKGTGRALF